MILVNPSEKKLSTSDETRSFVMNVATAAPSQSAPPRMGPDFSRLMNPWRKLNLKVEGVLLELETFERILQFYKDLQVKIKTIMGI